MQTFRHRISQLVKVTLLSIAITFIVGCSKKQEVVTYRLAYPKDAPTSPAQDPHAGHNHGPEGNDHGTSTELPPDHPPIGGSSSPEAMANMSIPNAAAAGPKPFNWATPEKWTDKPGNSMRIGSFAMPGPGGDADVSISQLGGMAGGLVANINRWRGQIGLSPQDDATIMAAGTEVPTGMGAPALVYEIFGDDGKTLLDYL